MVAPSLEPELESSNEMLHVECPWCSGPATVDGPELTVVECAECGVRAGLAVDPEPLPVAVAA
jgi:hypothetical protein